MNNFRRQNAKIASSACLKTDHFPTQSTTFVITHASHHYMLCWYMLCVLCAALLYSVCFVAIYCVRFVTICHAIYTVQRESRSSRQQENPTETVQLCKGKVVCAQKKNRGRCTLALPPPKTLRFSSIFNFIFHISNCQ